MGLTKIGAENLSGEVLRRAEDVTGLVLGLGSGFGEAGWRDSTLRLLDIVIAGLRA